MSGKQMPSDVKHAFDPECLKLAEYFLRDYRWPREITEPMKQATRHELAQSIQDSVEGFLDWLETT